MITKQIWKGLSFTGFKDHYSFEARCDLPKVKEITIQYYLSKRAILQKEDDTSLEFRRGKTIWKYLTPGFETWPSQTIQIRFEEGPTGIKIHITYSVDGWILRFPPYQLPKEAEGLERVVLELKTGQNGTNMPPTDHD